MYNMGCFTPTVRATGKNFNSVTHWDFLSSTEDLQTILMADILTCQGGKSAGVTGGINNTPFYFMSQ